VRRDQHGLADVEVTATSRHSQSLSWPAVVVGERHEAAQRVTESEIARGRGPAFLCFSSRNPQSLANRSITDSSAVAPHVVHHEHFEESTDCCSASATRQSERAAGRSYVGMITDRSGAVTVADRRAAS
jgi:hypothetical protein